MNPVTKLICQRLSLSNLLCKKLGGWTWEATPTTKSYLWTKPLAESVILCEPINFSLHSSPILFLKQKVGLYSLIASSCLGTIELLCNLCKVKDLGVQSKKVILHVAVLKLAHHWSGGGLSYRQCLFVALQLTPNYQWHWERAFLVNRRQGAAVSDSPSTPGKASKGSHSRHVQYDVSVLATFQQEVLATFQQATFQEEVLTPFGRKCCHGGRVLSKLYMYLVYCKYFCAIFGER